VPTPDPPRTKANSGGVRRLRLAIVAAALVVAVAVYVVPARWERARALSMAARGDFAVAEPGLKTAAERDPTDLDVVKALARGYLSAGDDVRASPFLARWTELRPRQSEPARLRFQNALQLGQTEEALAAGRHLLDLDPADRMARGQVGLVCLSLGKLDEAEQESRHCLRDDPDDPAALLLLGRVLEQKGDRAGAEAVVEGIFARGARSGEAVLLRAVLHLHADQPEKAIPLLRELVERWPGQKRFALYQLVVALKRAGQDEEAARQESLLHQLQTADVLLLDSNSTPHNLPLRVRAARALFAAGRAAEAVALLHAALERDPQFRDAHRLLADWYEKDSQPEEAERHRRLADGSP
jgi:predicted Zn-dependent protease